MDGKRIFVSGATGFIGARIVEAVQAAGHTVVALTLDESWVTPGDRIVVREIDLLEPASIGPAIADCDAGIHAAGSGPAASPEQIHELTVRASLNLAAACRHENVDRLVAISSAAVLEPGDTQYRRAKVEQEELLAAAGLELTLLRPTLVIGPYRDSRELTALVERLNRRRALSIPGNGRIRIQPVHVGDVAAAAVAAVLRDVTIGRRLVVAGPEGGIEYRQLVSEARERTGGPARIRGISLALLKIAAGGLGLIGRADGLRATIAFYSSDHLYSIAATVETLGIEPRSYEEAFSDAFGGAQGD